MVGGGGGGKRERERERERESAIKQSICPDLKENKSNYEQKPVVQNTAHQPVSRTQAPKQEYWVLMIVERRETKIQQGFHVSELIFASGGKLRSTHYRYPVWSQTQRKWRAGKSRRSP